MSKIKALSRHLTCDIYEHPIQNMCSAILQVLFCNMRMQHLTVIKQYQILPVCVIFVGKNSSVV